MKAEMVNCSACGFEIRKSATVCKWCNRAENFKKTRYGSLVSVGVQPRIVDKVLQLYPETTLGKKPVHKFFPNQSLFITGAAGSGKTVYAASCILHYLENYLTTPAFDRERGYPYFISSINLLKTIKQSFSTKGDSEKEIEDKFKKIPFLIIDDLGVEQSTDWAFTVLYSIIDHRFHNYLTTIYTSNLSLIDLVSKLEDDRIVRRIEEDCEIIELG